MLEEGNERTTGDFLLSKQKEKATYWKKSCRGRSSRLWVWHARTAQSSRGLFTLERLAALFPTEKIKQHEC